MRRQPALGLEREELEVRVFQVRPCREVEKTKLASLFIALYLEGDTFLAEHVGIYLM